MIEFPPLRTVVCRWPRPRVEEPERATAEALERLDLSARVRSRRIAVTAGSRGIRDIVPILRATVLHLRRLGSDPVVVAAMGSHGGGTSEGQRRVLAHLGVTETSVGATISTAMDTVVVGVTADGLSAYCDRVAASCDGILVINRLKPHTAFDEPFGSGLMKMLAVGLGKVEGATQIHRVGPLRLAAAIEGIARVHLDRAAVVGGLAIVENAYGETALIEAIPPEQLVARELVLYQEAKRLMPRLPVDELDVLIVDEIGKNFSGTGMDVHVIGRRRIAELPELPTPRIRRIVALRLSPHSDGNAQGIGLADFTTQRLVDAMDREITYLNTMTSTFLTRAFIPITLPSDREAIAAALETLGVDDPRSAHVIRIPNTLHLERILASDAVVERIAQNPDVHIGAVVPWAFTSDGHLSDLP
jgi:hypothetical protein